MTAPVVHYFKAVIRQIQQFADTVPGVIIKRKSATTSADLIRCVNENDIAIFAIANSGALILQQVGDTNEWRISGSSGVLQIWNQTLGLYHFKCFPDRFEVPSLRVTEGTNRTMGTATLVAGTVTVNTNKVTAASRIFLTNQSLGGTAGFLRVSARTVGTSFTITSSSGTDTSVVAWIMFEPGGVG